MFDVISRNTPQLHVRYEGRSWDLPLSDLDLGTNSSDEAIRKALAGYLAVKEASLRRYVIERHANGNLTIRPEAVFG
jgi:hypothetical protein